MNSVVPGRFCIEPMATKDNRTLYSAGHGLLIGESEKVGSAWHFDLIVSYTDGASDLDLGVSMMRKLRVVVDRQGPEGDQTTLRVPAYADWGAALWRDTLAGTPYDVRVDHMWRDGKGYVWISTFGKHNAGEHVMDYDTGALLYTYHGFENASPFPGPHGLYFNPSGISVVGGFGEPGAIAVVAVESVIPLPTLKAIAFFVDVSALPPLP